MLFIAILTAYIALPLSHSQMNPYPPEPIHVLLLQQSTLAAVVEVLDDGADNATGIPYTGSANIRCREICGVPEAAAEDQYGIVYPAGRIGNPLPYVAPKRGVLALIFLDSRDRRPGVYNQARGGMPVASGDEEEVCAALREARGWDRMTDLQKARHMARLVAGSRSVRTLGLTLGSLEYSQLVGKFPEEFLPGLLLVLSDRERAPHHGSRATSLLGRITFNRPNTIVRLINLLDDPDPEVSREAVTQLQPLLADIMKEPTFAGQPRYSHGDLKMRPDLFNAEVTKIKSWWRNKGSRDPRYQPAPQ